MNSQYRTAMDSFLLWNGSQNNCFAQENGRTHLQLAFNTHPGFSCTPSYVDDFNRNNNNNESAKKKKKKKDKDNETDASESVNATTSVTSEPVGETKNEAGKKKKKKNSKEKETQENNFDSDMKSIDNETLDISIKKKKKHKKNKENKDVLDEKELVNNPVLTDDLSSTDRKAKKARKREAASSDDAPECDVRKSKKKKKAEENSESVELPNVVGAEICVEKASKKSRKKKKKEAETAERTEPLIDPPMVMHEEIEKSGKRKRKQKTDDAAGDVAIAGGITKKQLKRQRQNAFKQATQIEKEKQKEEKTLTRRQKRRLANRTLKKKMQQKELADMSNPSEKASESLVHKGLRREERPSFKDPTKSRSVVDTSSRKPSLKRPKNPARNRSNDRHKKPSVGGSSNLAASSGCNELAINSLVDASKNSGSIAIAGSASHGSIDNQANHEMNMLQFSLGFEGATLSTVCGYFATADDMLSNNEPGSWNAKPNNRQSWRR